MKRKGDTTRAVSILFGIGMLFISGLWVVFVLPDILAFPEFSLEEEEVQVTLVNETVVDTPQENVTMSKATKDLIGSNCTIIELLNFEPSYVNINMTYSDFYQLALNHTFIFKYTGSQTSILLVKESNNWYAWRPEWN
jgi:hypothetical protein